MEGSVTEARSHGESSGGRSVTGFYGQFSNFQFLGKLNGREMHRPACLWLVPRANGIFLWTAKKILVLSMHIKFATNSCTMKYGIKPL